MDDPPSSVMELSLKLQDQLTDVQRVVASTLAFAALKGDGSVVAWGPWYAGGDASNVQDLMLQMGGKDVGLWI